MKAESLITIKKELRHKSAEEMFEICLRLTKYKADNKELLSFLLFHEKDVNGYAQLVMEEIDRLFEEVNINRLYLAKKGVRKILRIANKHIKYASSKDMEIEVLMYFCEKMKKARIPFNSSPALLNLYERQLIRIETAIGKLHEDLQYDWNQQFLERNLTISYFSRS